nr:hypothetical protein [Actinacidiphila yeochonensis]
MPLPIPLPKPIIIATTVSDASPWVSGSTAWPAPSTSIDGTAIHSRPKRSMIWPDG